MEAPPPPPPGLDLSATQVPRMVGAMASTWVLAVIAVFLRFLCRRLTRISLWWDDWLMIPAVVAAGVFFLIATAYGNQIGLGRHLWAAPSNALEGWAISVFISELAYTTCLATVKFSLLAFYWRIFKFSQIRIPIYLMAGIVSCWAIAVILVSIFQCTPVNFLWTQWSPEAQAAAAEGKPAGHCAVSDNLFFPANSIPNIITDILIIVLPLPFVWKLQLARAQKLALTSIFVLGLFVTGVSIARLHFILSLNLVDPDITWNFVDSSIWSAVELNIAIVSACLLSLKPLLNLMLFGSLEGHKKQGGSGGSTGHAWNTTHSHVKLEEQPDLDTRRASQLPHGNGSSSLHSDLAPFIEDHDVSKSTSSYDPTTHPASSGAQDIRVDTHIRVNHM